VRRTAFAWAGGVAVTLIVTVAAVVLAGLLGALVPLGRDREHAGWLGVFVGFPFGAALGGFVAGRMAGYSIPTAAWVALNPGVAVCLAVLASQANAYGMASEYFRELVGPSFVITLVSLAGALWGRRQVSPAPPVPPEG
jgi:hypothetical protein